MYKRQIIYQGEVCQFKVIKDSEAKGIVIIHQELALVPYLSIGENMYLGNERGGKFHIDWDETYNKADALLKEVGPVSYTHLLRCSNNHHVFSFRHAASFNFSKLLCHGLW